MDPEAPSVKGIPRKVDWISYLIEILIQASDLFTRLCTVHYQSQLIL